MKKLLFTSLTILGCFSAFAQFEKGRVLAGGGISFSTNTNKTKTDAATTTDSKTTSFNLMPKGGYFFMDNVAGGVGLDWIFRSTKSETTDNKNNSFGFVISPFVRYYLKPGVFFQGAYGIGPANDKQKAGSTTVTTKYTSSNWSLGAGYAYFLNDHVAVEPLIGYGSLANKYKSPDAKYKSSGLFINIGLQIYLDFKK